MSENKMHKVQGEPMGVGWDGRGDSPRYLPSFSLTDKDFPEIKNWKVGKKYMIEMEVEQVASSKDEFGKSPLTARFKIHKIGKKEMMSEKEKKGRMGHY